MLIDAESPRAAQPLNPDSKVSLKISVTSAFTVNGAIDNYDKAITDESRTAETLFFILLNLLKLKIICLSTIAYYTNNIDKSQ